jgi:RND family efflux transporter MFP subunit
MMTMRRSALLVAAALGTAACGGHEQEPAAAAAASVDGVEYDVVLAARAPPLEAAGVAAPVAESMLSTRLMGAVTAVLVQEGDRVRAGQPLVRIDARDLAAKAEQVMAGRAEAEAVLREAELHVQRMRALHADDAAPRAQLDHAETGLARARAAVAAAEAGAAELSALRDYSVVTAPFAGVVIRRLVDPGSFAAPGAPLLVVQDASRLRISVSAAPGAVRNLARGAVVRGTVEGEAVAAVVEGVVPVSGTSLYMVNAIVENANGHHPAGGAATLALPAGARPMLLVPSGAVVRRGALTGLYVRQSGRPDELRWVRLGPVAGDSVEVTGGIRDGERIVIPAVQTAGR